MKRRILPIIAILALAGVSSFAAETHLSDLDLSCVTQGWGYAHTNQSVAGLPLKIGGQNFTNGIGTHAPSLAVVQLDGQANSFHALVGVNDGGRNEPGAVEFIVLGDGKPLFKSGVMHGGDTARPVNVLLAGVKRLELQVTAVGDNNNSDHADWAEAVITFSGRPPELVAPNAEFCPASLYPPADKLIPSPGTTTYFVDPVNGDDANAGASAGKPWKNFAKVNALALAPGDKVIIAPGVHRDTLKPSAIGSKEKPVVIQFLSGRHEFRADGAIKLCYFVSNSADAPLKPRPIGILVKNARHLH